MITTFLICVVTLMASDCSTIHPDLNQLIPDYDHNPNIKPVELNIIDCRDMYSNISLLQLCYQQWGPEIDP